MNPLHPSITASPCTGICRLAGDDICLGCFRTRDEITGWMAMSDAEKAAVNLAATERRIGREKELNPIGR
jgi:hypothetical protein